METTATGSLATSEPTNSKVGISFCPICLKVHLDTGWAQVNENIRQDIIDGRTIVTAREFCDKCSRTARQTASGVILCANCGSRFIGPFTDHNGVSWQYKPQQGVYSVRIITYKKLFCTSCRGLLPTQSLLVRSFLTNNAKPI